METILVLADTHLPECDVFPDWLEQALKGVRLVIHAGDFTSRSFFEQLVSRVEVAGVIGNMDRGALIGRLSDRLVVEIDGVRIGVTHGWDGPAEVKRVAKTNLDNPDMMIFGHTHCAFDGEWEGLKMFNPGSPTRPRDSTLGSYGLMTIHNGEWSAEHIRIGSPLG